MNSSWEEAIQPSNARECADFPRTASALFMHPSFRELSIPEARFPRIIVLGFSVNRGNLRSRAQAISFTGDLGFLLLLGGCGERRQDYVRDNLWLRDHDHVGA